jgi:hypothetical protein
MVLSFGAADAADPVGLKSTGVSGGILLPPEGWENGFALELRSDFGEVMKYVFLMPHIGYWHAKRMDLSYTNIYFGTKFIGYFNSRPRGIYAGLGIQFHIIEQEEISGGYNEVEDEVTKANLTRIGYSLIAGYLLIHKQMTFSFEPAYTVLPGADNMVSISLGVGYLFP